MTRVAQRVINRNVEKKYIDLGFNFNVSDAGSLTNLMPITVGTGDQNQRIGDKIKALSMKFRSQIYSADTTNFMRFILFQWHPDSAAYPPSIGLILNNTTSMYAMYNHDQGTNFSIFFDKTYSLAASGTANRALNWTFRFGRSKSRRMKFVKPIVKFTAGGSTGNDLMYLLILTDSPTAPHPGYIGSMRFTYTDA